MIVLRRLAPLALLLFAGSGVAAAEAPPPAMPGIAGRVAPPAEPSPITPPAAPALPPPTLPSEWPTTMGDMTVDGVSAHGVHATCGLFEIVPLVGAIAHAVASCPSLPGTYAAISLEGGHPTALSTRGPAAACVETALSAGMPGMTCTIEMTFVAPSGE